MLAGGERGWQTGGGVVRGELRTRLRTPAGSVVLEPGAGGPDRGEDDPGDDARTDREARSAASYRMCVTHRNPRAPAPGRPLRARMPVSVIVRSSNECRVQAASDSTARESAQKVGPPRAYATPPAVRPGACWTPGCWVCGGEAVTGKGCGRGPRPTARSCRPGVWRPAGRLLRRSGGTAPPCRRRRRTPAPEGGRPSARCGTAAGSRWLRHQCLRHRGVALPGV